MGEGTETPKYVLEIEEYITELEHKCRDCGWIGGRGDLDTDQCPECASFNIRTERW